MARGLDARRVETYRAQRDYEGLEMYVLGRLMGDNKARATPSPG